MHITFGLHLDSPHHLGPLPAASLDRLVAGPQRLLSLLEAHLGLTAPVPARSRRVAQLAAILQQTPNPAWHASASQDALGTAQRLLDDYDALRLHGWHLQPTPRRLGDLATACQSVAAGFADRLRQAIAALHQTPVRIQQVTLADPMDALPVLWQQLLAALQVPLTPLAPQQPAGPSGSDLGAAQCRRGGLRGDGSVQLYRPGSPGLGAEHAAAFVEGVGSQNVCVIGPDAILDAALARRGLPTHGCVGRCGDGATQLIALAIELAYAPADPAVVVQWLTVHPNPLPPPVCRALQQAMQQWPAVGSPPWLAAVPTHVPTLRLFNRLFQARLSRLTDLYPLSELLERGALLRDWFNTLAVTPRPALQAVTELMDAAQAMGTAAFTQGQVAQLVALCMQSAKPAPAHPAQVGAWQSTPAGMLAAAPYVLWWNCSSAQVPPLDSLQISHAEAATLQQQGLVWPRPRALARQQAEAWRRPLAAAQQGFLGVAPARNAAGEACTPHPLWDEILAQAPRGERAATAARLTVERPQHAAMPPLQTTELRVLPNAAGVLQLQGRGLRRAAPESPSSLETRLGCSFRWALLYLAEVRDEPLPSTEVTPLELGSLAHELLAAVVGSSNLDANAAAERIAHNLDTVGPQHVAALFLPRGALQKQQLSRYLQSTVRHFVQLRAAHHFEVQTEVLRERAWGDLLLRGRIDVLLSNPVAVLDFKFASRAKHRDKLQGNTATQLAAYSYIVQEPNAPLPQVGYFIIQDAQLFTTGDLDMGVTVQGAQVQTMWDGLQRAVLQSETELQAGRVHAPGTDPALARARETLSAEGVLHLPPPCTYCTFAALCRRAP